LRRIASTLEIESILPKLRYMELSYNATHPNGDSIKLRCNGNFVPPIFTAPKFDGENAASYAAGFARVASINIGFNNVERVLDLDSSETVRFRFQQCTLSIRKSGFASSQTRLSVIEAAFFAIILTANAHVRCSYRVYTTITVINVQLSMCT